MRIPLSPRACSALAAGGIALAGLTGCGGSSHAATAPAPAAATPIGEAPAATPIGEAHAAHADEAHAGPGQDTATAAAAVATSTVTIENFAFSPAAITVKAGTTVTWTNKDEEPHSVVATDEPMHSPTLAGKDNTFSHTFTKPGRYNYNCGIHPFMHGTVEVTA